MVEVADLCASMTRMEQMLQKMNQILDRFNGVPGATHPTAATAVASSTAHVLPAATTSSKNAVPTTASPASATSTAVPVLAGARRQGGGGGAAVVPRVLRAAHLGLIWGRAPRGAAAGGAVPSGQQLPSAPGPGGPRGGAPAAGGAGVWARRVRARGQRVDRRRAQPRHLQRPHHADLHTARRRQPQCLRLPAHHTGRLDGGVRRAAAGPELHPVPSCLAARKKITKKLPNSRVASLSRWRHKTSLKNHDGKHFMLVDVASTPSSSVQEHVHDAPTTCLMMGPCSDTNTSRGADTFVLEADVVPRAPAAPNAEPKVSNNSPTMCSRQDCSDYSTPAVAVLLGVSKSYSIVFEDVPKHVKPMPVPTMTAPSTSVFKEKPRRSWRSWQLVHYNQLDLQLRQPWPPPVQSEGVQLRPTPWPSFSYHTAVSQLKMSLSMVNMGLVNHSCCTSVHIPPARRARMTVDNVKGCFLVLFGCMRNRIVQLDKLHQDTSVWLAGTRAFLKTAMSFGIWHSGQYLNTLFSAICIDNLKSENWRKIISASESNSTGYRVMLILDETKFAHEPSLTCYQIEEQQWECIDLNFTKASYNTYVLTEYAFVSGPGGQSEQVQSLLLFTEADHHRKRFCVAKIAIAWYPPDIIFKLSVVPMRTTLPILFDCYINAVALVLHRQPTEYWRGFMDASVSNIRDISVPLCFIYFGYLSADSTHEYWALGWLLVLFQYLGVNSTTPWPSFCRSEVGMHFLTFDGVGILILHVTSSGWLQMFGKAVKSLYCETHLVMFHLSKLLWSSAAKTWVRENLVGTPGQCHHQYIQWYCCGVFDSPHFDLIMCIVVHPMLSNNIVVNLKTQLLQQAISQFWALDQNLEDADMLSYCKALQPISLFYWRFTKAMDQYLQSVLGLWDPGGSILQWAHSETPQLNYNIIIELPRRQLTCSLSLQMGIIRLLFWHLTVYRFDGIWHSNSKPPYQCKTKEICKGSAIIHANRDK